MIPYRLKNQFLAFFLIFFPIIWWAASCQPENRPPNIILITVDDLGWTDLGCYGSTYYETPHIDRMAAEGIIFTNAYAAAAVCSPTRSAIQTGKYPVRTGITDWIRARFQGGGDENLPGYDENPGEKLRTPRNPFHLELKEVTLAEWLKNAGYITAHIGKWHLGTEKWYPTEQGYDVNVAGCDYGQPPGYFDPYIVYPNAWLKDTLKGFPTMDPRKEGEYLTDREADEAVRFIREHRNEPFFLNLCHYAVHTPIQGKKSLVEKYESKKPTNQKSPVYAAMVESVDDALGMIRQSVRELGIEKNTVIIFTSDNGGLLMDQATDNTPLRKGKGYPYEGGIRIPALFCWPGHYQGGETLDVPIISMDLLPTICHLAGIDISPDTVLDGVDLTPLLEKGIVPSRERLFWHFPHYRSGNIKPYSIIRKGDWKLIRRYEGEPLELYNLKEDLSETHDLAGDHPDLAGSLNRELEEWLNEAGARLPEMKEMTIDGTLPESKQ
jgi:arylsulfatase A